MITRTKSLLAVSSALALMGCGNPSYWYTYVFSELAESTVTKNPWSPAQSYRDVHNAAPAIIDLHADTLLAPDEGTYLERIVSNPDKDGHVDIPRLLEGNVALQVFAVGTKASLDTLGDSFPLITGKFNDAQGNSLSRYGYERDPNVRAYDDLNDPYVGDYGGAPTYMPRDVATYAFRLGGFSCLTWYEDGNWDVGTWGPTPPCPKFDAERVYVQRFLEAGQRLLDASKVDPRLRVVRTRADLDTLLADRTSRKLVGGLLSTEGLYFRSDASTAAGDARLVRTFDDLYGAGFRMFALTHFIDNDHGGSSTGMEHARSATGRDLTPAGRRFAELVLTRNAVLDVAHASRATLASLASFARTKQRPLVFSHGGLSKIPGTKDQKCDNPRNLTDDQVVDIASTGGVVGIGYAADFVCDTDPAAWARAVRHAVDVINNAEMRLYKSASGPLLRGVDHVALGSDYDGGIKPYTDVAHLNQYTRALMCPKSSSPSCLDVPFTKDEVYKILGGNALRVLRTNLPAN